MSLAQIVLLLLDDSVFLLMETNHLLTLLILRHLSQLSVQLNLLVELLIALFIGVILLSQQVIVVVQAVVLVLSLDVSGNDLLQIRDAALSFDMVEHLLQSLSVFDILINERLLLAVDHLDFVDSINKDFDWIGELLLIGASLALVVGPNLKRLVIELNGVVPFLELILELPDLNLKPLLLLFMLGLECEYLVIGLPGHPVVLVALGRQRQALLFKSVDLRLHLVNGPLGKPINQVS